MHALDHLGCVLDCPSRSSTDPACVCVFFSQIWAFGRVPNFLCRALASQSRLSTSAVRRLGRAAAQVTTWVGAGRRSPMSSLQCLRSRILAADSSCHAAHAMTFAEPSEVKVGQGQVFALGILNAEHHPRRDYQSSRSTVPRRSCRGRASRETGAFIFIHFLVFPRSSAVVHE